MDPGRPPPGRRADRARRAPSRLTPLRVEGDDLAGAPARNARAVLAAELGENALAVHADKALRIGSAHVHHADDRGAEPLQHADLLHVRLGIRSEDGHRLELLVGDLLAVLAD